jgi:hypothetical protein
MKRAFRRKLKKTRFVWSRVFAVCLVITVFAGAVFAQKYPHWDTVQAFKKDVAPYREAVLWITSMQEDRDKDWSPIYSADTIRKSLESASAFAEIIKQKYANVEDPSWATNWDDKIGSWRRLIENRDQIAREYVSAKIGAALKGKAAQLDKDRGNFASYQGFSLPVGFDERDLLHSIVSKEFTPIFAAAGLTMPENSVFALYDKSVDAILDEAKKHAGDWKWDATLHDAAAEAKARLWMKSFDPKGEVVKTGMSDAAWQVNKNNLGIPTGRYKRGKVMYRKPGLEQCIVAKFSFEQTYQGGGQYNAMSNTSGFTYLVRLQNCK